MSTASLPSYVAPSLNFVRTPVYSAEPREYEQRLAWNRVHNRPSGEITKQSRSGGVSLRFLNQQDHAELPVYGYGGVIEGVVEIAKPEGVHSVDVKIKGTLVLKEIAEGGTVTYELCLSRMSLWDKESNSGACPASLAFSLELPTTFNDGKDDYPLPPTHEVHLTGMPGFRATVVYSVTTHVYRGGLVKKAASTLIPKQQNNNAVTTNFVYFPRSRPSAALPPTMVTTTKPPGVVESAEWRCFKSTIPSRSSGVNSIISSLYLPASRVFCMSEPIPFHLCLTANATSLAAFMPYGPTPSLLSQHKQHTRIQLLRQSVVDVRNAVVLGTKTDIWRVSNIGTGTFHRATDGPEFISFYGEIQVSEDVKIPGFKAGGLSIKDCIVLTMIPPDISKSPFDELRCVVPVRLTTDPWTNDGSAGAGVAESQYSTPSSEEDASWQLPPASS